MSHPVLLVRTGAPAPGTGEPPDYDPWFLAAMAPVDVSVTPWDAARGAPAPEHLDWAAVVITGSPASVHDHEPWSVLAGEWCARAVRDGVPVLGVCYGLQLLADALGGRTGPNPHGPEYGVCEVEMLADDPLLPPGRTPTYQLHFNAVLEVPPGARVLARSDTTAVQALAFGPRARGVQWHPELDAGYLDRAIRRRAHLLDGAAPGLAERAAASVRELPEAGAPIARFLTDIAGIPSKSA